MTVDIAVKSGCVLGESPRWHPLQERLLWVDIESQAVWSFDPSTDSTRMSKLHSRVCCVTPNLRGGYLAAMAESLIYLDEEFSFLSTIHDSAPPALGTRWNDGKCDAAGRFIVGSSFERTPRQPDGCVAQFTAQGWRRLLIPDVKVANSICFNQLGSAMYFADTFERCIWRYGYDADEGILKDRDLFCSLAGEPGWPDGSAIDADDCVWNAQWGGGRIVRYTPKGKVDQVISIPTPQPTSIAFGSKDLCTAFVTTARMGMSDEQLRCDPYAGHLLAFRVSPGGVPEVLFNG